MGTIAHLASYATLDTLQTTVDEILVIPFLIAILLIVAWWQIFTKAGLKGWYVLVPFYNVYKVMEIARVPRWFFWTLVLMFPAYYVIVRYTVAILVFNIAYALLATSLLFYLLQMMLIVTFAIYVITIVYLAKAFDRTELFGFGLLVLPWIFLFVLAFNSNIRYGADIDTQRLQKGYVMVNGIPVRLDQLSTQSSVGAYPTTLTTPPATDPHDDQPARPTPPPPVDLGASLWDQAGDEDAYFPFPQPTSPQPSSPQPGSPDTQPTAAAASTIASSSIPEPAPAPPATPAPTPHIPDPQPARPTPAPGDQDATTTDQPLASSASQPQTSPGDQTQVPSPQTSPVPGWYNVADDTNQRAWWDGTAWSNHQHWDGSQWCPV